MKAKLFLPAALLLSLGFAPLGTPPTKIVGDYVEARTASVFAGACHFNGELVTTGNDAIMAWNITAGTWKGTDLAGVRAMAAVTCGTNLRDEQAARKSELVVDSAATAVQAESFADMLRSKFAATMGPITAVRRSNIVFHNQDLNYSARGENFGELVVQPMPNNECCSQPSLVWYTPITPLEHRKVGFTENASYTAGTLGDSWQRAGENSAFYGTFAW